MRKIILSLSLLLASSAAFAQNSSSPGFVYPDRGSAYFGCLSLYQSWVGVAIPGLNSGHVGCAPSSLSQCNSIMTNNGSGGFVTASVSGFAVNLTPNVGLDCSGSTTTFTNRGLTNEEFGAWLIPFSNYFSHLGITVTFRANDSQCNQRPPTTNLRHPGANGTGTVCDLGCQLVIAASANTSTGVVTWEGEYNNLTCQPGQFPEAITYDPTQPQDTDGDGIPDISDPCPQDIYNECTGTNQPTNPTAPPNTAGGGQTCNSPPVCNGDSVQCSILYQSWAARCEAQPGEFDDSNIVDAINDLRTSSNPLLQQIADNTANLNNSSPGGGLSPGDSANLASTAANSAQTVEELVGLREDLSQDGVDPGWEGFDDLGQLTGQVEFTTDMLDDTGMGFPRTCPTWQDINFNLGPTPINIPLSSFTVHCTIFAWVGYLIVALAAFQATQILIRG